MARFLTTLRLRRWLRVTFWAFIGVTAAFAICVGYLTWAGGRALREATDELAREGETLDFKALLPEPVPDAENFCAIPLLKGVALYPGRSSEHGSSSSRWKTLENRLPASDHWTLHPSMAGGDATGLRINLRAWADFLRKAKALPVAPASEDAAREVLTALSRHDPVVKELATGLDRPKSQLTPTWKTRSLPSEPSSFHGQKADNLLFDLVQLLCLRSIAAAQTGDPTRAFESLRVAAKLNEASLEQPFFLGAVLARVQTNLIDGAVWELCDAHIGSAEDFRALQRALGRLDYHRPALWTIRTEMAFQVNSLVRYSDDPILILRGVQAVGPPGPSGVGPPVSWISRGWFEMNEAAMIRTVMNFEVKPLRMLLRRADKMPDRF